MKNKVCIILVTLLVSAVSYGWLREDDVATRGYLKQNVSISFYTNASDETDDTPGVNACGLPPTEGDVAVSRDLLGKIPCGTFIRVRLSDGTTYRLTVHDTMGEYTIKRGAKSWKNGKITNSIDIYVTNKTLAKKLGRLEGILYYPKQNDWRNGMLYSDGHTVDTTSRTW